MVKAGFAVLAALRAERWAPRVSPWQGAILMFHRVRPDTGEAFQPNRHLEVTPDYLDFTVGRLKAQGVEIVSMDEAVERIARPGSRRFAAITFDDGYADNHDHALPILKRHGAPFTVYVASGLIDGTARAWWMTLEEILRARSVLDVAIAGTRRRLDLGTAAAKCRAAYGLYEALRRTPEAERSAWLDRLTTDVGFDIPAMLARHLMTWDAVAAMAAEPLVTIGAHTVDHPSLATLDAASARREMAGGRDRIAERIGRRPQHFAYPFGRRQDISARTVEIAAELGFRSAVTTHPGLLRAGAADGLHVLPRVSINGLYQTARHFDMLMSGAPFMIAGLMKAPPGECRARPAADPVGRRDGLAASAPGRLTGSGGYRR